MSGALTERLVLSSNFLAALDQLPDGYRRGSFRGRRWGLTVRRASDRRRIWLYGEDLAGTDIVSFNLYIGAGDEPLLKPCEMSASKVIEFVVEFSPDAVGGVPGCNGQT